MIYYTGDIHGSRHEVMSFCSRVGVAADDTVVILGDVGANYACDGRDRSLKQALNSLGPTIFCIHGNHERRPATLPSYRMKEWNGGSVWYEEEYPNLLFAKDGDIFTIEEISHLVIGGAYSVDKYYRLSRGYSWWEDEQPSTEIKAYVESQIQKNRKVDVVLSHTCPFRYEPVEAFLPMIDQDSVDDSTERWLDKIEAQLEYTAWMCGHWHINKRIDRMHFLFHDFESAEQLVQGHREGESHDEQRPVLSTGIG